LIHFAGTFKYIFTTPKQTCCVQANSPLQAIK